MELDSFVDMSISLPTTIFTQSKSCTFRIPYSTASLRLSLRRCQSTTVLQGSDRLSNLPGELQALICLNLKNSDIKNLRLTNKRLSGAAILRFKRVFLSANPLNIEVFRAIAGHETFRKRVVEIIWDDALLRDPCASLDINHPSRLSCYFDQDENRIDGPPLWFEEALQQYEEQFYTRMKDHKEESRPENIRGQQQFQNEMHGSDCYDHYQELLKQQTDIIKTGADVDAFRYGMQQLPALKRIEITPAAHGWLHRPLYSTPMIRALPHGFNYAIPRGWPSYDFPNLQYLGFREGNLSENTWRGFHIVMQQLAQMNHQISELLIDSHYLNTGLDSSIFKEPCLGYENFTALLQKPQFRRLTLNLDVTGQKDLGWPVFRSGYLQQALAKAAHMEHFSLRANMGLNSTFPAYDINGRPRDHTPLNIILPINGWEHLKHFSLGGLLVEQDDLVSFLDVLPLSVQSIELSFLAFTNNGYYNLLRLMRNKLSWHKREPSRRPKVIIGTNLWEPIIGRAVWLQDEIGGFLYNGDRNPFYRESSHPRLVKAGKGVVKDDFDTDFEYPYTDYYGSRSPQSLSSESSAATAYE